MFKKHAPKNQPRRYLTYPAIPNKGGRLIPDPRPQVPSEPRLRKTSEPGLRGLAPDEDGLVPLEELWKLLQRLGSFKAGDVPGIAKGSPKDRRFVDGL